MAAPGEEALWAKSVGREYQHADQLARNWGVGLGDQICLFDRCVERGCCVEACGTARMRVNRVFGCMSQLACHYVCPKELPLQTQVAFVRRMQVKKGV
jgi:succinate dehydrogenase/fumarate reductase-like Fe-S protein